LSKFLPEFVRRYGHDLPPGAEASSQRLDVQPDPQHANAARVADRWLRFMGITQAKHL